MQLQPCRENAEKTPAKVVDLSLRYHHFELIKPSTKRIDELEARVDLMQTYLEKLLVPSAVTPQKLPVTVLGQKHDTGAMSFLRPFDEGTPLPPVTETLPLIEYYFENFNRVVPLFDESSFLLKIKETSGKQHEDDPAWWAAVNVALSIAHRFRGIESISAGKENQRALDYLRNALGVVSELTLGDPDLLGVQALLGISIILQGTDRPRQASALVASTIRLCHNLGLHKQENNSGLSSIEIEQRSRTFWIAYQLDKDYSIRLSQSPIQSDDEIELPLPGERTDDGMGQILTNDGASVMNFFRLWVELSVILSQTYSMLHTAQALKQGDFKRFQAVEVLDQRLEKWTQSIPSPFRPENMTKALPKGAILHMVILYLSYFNCLSRVHLAAIDQSVWTTGWLSPNDFSWAKLSKSSREKVLQAARASIYLLGLTPQGDNACTW